MSFLNVCVFGWLAGLGFEGMWRWGMRGMGSGRVEPWAILVIWWTESRRILLGRELDPVDRL